MPELMEGSQMQARLAMILQRMTREGILEARQVMHAYRMTSAQKVVGSVSGAVQSGRRAERREQDIWSKPIHNMFDIQPVE